MGTSLVELLLPRPRHAEEDLTELERALDDAIARAESASAGVALDRRAFVAHLARWLPPDRAPREGLAALRVEELHLACAAAEGHPAAIARIESLHFAKAKAALARNVGAGAIADEALQRVREALFVGGPERPPKIREYGGRGDLASWIRTVAMRAAMDLLSPSREVPAPEQALAGASRPSDDPALELMKREYSASFKRALHEALAELPQQTRDELRHYYLEGLGVEQIGAMYGVAASTVSRRLEKARRELRDRTLAALAARHRVSDSELDSVLRMIDTRLEMDRSALAERGAGGDDDA